MTRKAKMHILLAIRALERAHKSTDRIETILALAAAQRSLAVALEIAVKGKK